MQPKLSKAAKRIAERERKLEEIRQQGREQVANGEVPDKAKIEDEMFEKQMNRMGKVIVKVISFCKKSRSRYNTEQKTV